MTACDLGCDFPPPCETLLWVALAKMLRWKVLTQRMNLHHNNNLQKKITLLKTVNYSTENGGYPEEVGMGRFWELGKNVCGQGVDWCAGKKALTETRPPGQEVGGPAGCWTGPGGPKPRQNLTLTLT